MASTSVIDGNFVTSKFSEWDAFTDRQGQPRAAGRSFKVFVYTEHDQDLCEVRFAPERIDAAREVAKSLGFGVQVQVL